MNEYYETTVSFPADSTAGDWLCEKCGKPEYYFGDILTPGWPELCVCDSLPAQPIVNKQGWRCPCCQTMYSPDTDTCWWCSPPHGGHYCY